jgi:hypothetical protein
MIPYLYKVTVERLGWWFPGKREVCVRGAWGYSIARLLEDPRLRQAVGEMVFGKFEIARIKVIPDLCHLLRGKFVYLTGAGGWFHKRTIVKVHLEVNKVYVSRAYLRDGVATGLDRSFLYEAEDAFMADAAVRELIDFLS